MNPRRLYLTDQDARGFEQLLTHRTAQRDRAYTAIVGLSAALICLLAVLFAVIS